jgi:hypothetical protein
LLPGRRATSIAFAAVTPVWSYARDSSFLRWWPKILIAAAVVVIVIGVHGSIQWAALFALVAYVHGRWLPWRFRVFDDGIALTFPFGRRVFLPKSATTVRVSYAGAVALVGRARRFGYPLLDQVLYQPDNTPRLRLALTVSGYDIKE